MAPSVARSAGPVSGTGGRSVLRGARGAGSGRASLGGADALDFNDFDGALCDALTEAVLDVRVAFWAGFFAAPLVTALLALVLLTLAAGFLADAFEPRAILAADDFAADVRLDFPEEALEDFLRVFLDIRLPFVAFRGSTIRVLRILSLIVGFAPAARQV